MAGNSSEMWSWPVEKWTELNNLYPIALKAKADKKSKPQAKKELVELDDWYQKELPKIIQSRSSPYLTADEIQKLMKWKLARGKFRPALPGLVASNTAENVKKTSCSAFKKLPKLEAAIKELSTLRGIGPATASAIVAAVDPDAAPFMADECVLATPEISVIKYDLPCYLIYAESLQKVTKRLKKEDPEGQWTVHKAELSVWTHAVLSTLAPDSLPSGDDKDNNNTQNAAANRKKRSLVKTNEDITSSKRKR